MHDLDIRPLTPRSLVLNALLGTDPGRLPVAALVALGELFEIQAGAVRTALSRMVSEGELLGGAGHYELGPRLAARKRDQDSAIGASAPDWDGDWWFALVVPGGRSLSERREFRARMMAHRLAELSPTQWLRPTNIPGPPDDADDVIVTRGALGRQDPLALSKRLWDIGGLRQRGEVLLRATAEAKALLTSKDLTVLRQTFPVSMAAVRYLRSDPRLPPQIVGDDWPATEVRADYAQLEQATRALLRGLFWPER